jgi:hypothetical protein
MSLTCLPADASSSARSVTSMSTSISEQSQVVVEPTAVAPAIVTTLLGALARSGPTDSPPHLKPARSRRSLLRVFRIKVPVHGAGMKSVNPSHAPPSPVLPPPAPASSRIAHNHSPIVPEAASIAESHVVLPPSPPSHASSSVLTTSPNTGRRRRVDNRSISGETHGLFLLLFPIAFDCCSRLQSFGCCGLWPKLCSSQMQQRRHPWLRGGPGSRMAQALTNYKRSSMRAHLLCWRMLSLCRRVCRSSVESTVKVQGYMIKRGHFRRNWLRR